MLFSRSTESRIPFENLSTFNCNRTKLKINVLIDSEVKYTFSHKLMDRLSQHYSESSLFRPSSGSYRTNPVSFTSYSHVSQLDS